MGKARIRNLTVGAIAAVALLVAAPASAGSLHGTYVGKSTEARLWLKLPEDVYKTEGKLTVRGASAADTAGHEYGMRCGDRNEKPRFVFGEYLLEGENPITFSIFRVKGKYCKVTVDRQLLTKIKLRRKG